jgi:catechol 2,3-dioxygenase-like lactoylglutathione lyase family enzyme
VKLALDHAVIAVSEWERSKRFYSEVLQAELIERPDGGAHFRFGSQQLNVHGPGASAHPLARVPVTPGNSDLCFRWEGRIEAAVEHLQAHGVEIEEGPVERHGAGGRGISVYFRDPDGTLLELISYGE